MEKIFKYLAKLSDKNMITDLKGDIKSDLQFKINGIQHSIVIPKYDGGYALYKNDGFIVNALTQSYMIDRIEIEVEYELA